MAVVAGVASVIGAAAGIAGAVTGGVARERESKQQRKELEMMEESQRIQRGEVEAQTKFDVGQVYRQGARQLGTFKGGMGAAGVRGASVVAVSQDIQTQTKKIAERRQAAGESRSQVIRKQEDIYRSRRKFLEKNKGLLTASSALNVGSAAMGGAMDVYSAGSTAGWWK